MSTLKNENIAWTELDFRVCNNNKYKMATSPTRETIKENLG
jgi:hypothetical protein